MTNNYQMSLNLSGDLTSSLQLRQREFSSMQLMVPGSFDKQINLYTINKGEKDYKGEPEVQKLDLNSKIYTSLTVK